MSEQNVAVGRRWFEEVWNQGKVDIANELAAPDCAAHGHAPNDAAIGIPQFKEFARGVLAAFPDIHVVVEDTVSEGDRAVIRWHAKMTHQAPFAGVDATGRKVAVRGITIMRFADGKIAEAWDNWDQFGLLTQLGAIPTVEFAKAS
jgi:steroid delta-isomerase-like uncharacterized protein